MIFPTATTSMLSLKIVLVTPKIWLLELILLKYRVENPRGHLRALRLNLLPSRSLCAPRWIARRWYPKRGGNIRKPVVQRELRRAVCYRGKGWRGGERMGWFRTFPPRFGYHRRANDRGLLEEQEGNRFKRSARKWPLGFSTRYRQISTEKPLTMLCVGSWEGDFFPWLSPPRRKRANGNRSVKMTKVMLGHARQSLHWTGRRKRARWKIRPFTVTA